MSRTSRGCVALALAGVGFTVLAACTSARPIAQQSLTSRATDPPTPASTPTTPPSTPPSTTSVPPTSVAPTHRHRHPSPTATTSPPPSTSSAPAPPPSSSSVSPSTCRKVTIRLIRGGAAQGTEIAALQYTNSGSSPCALGDYPQVVLLRNGQSVGSPSQPQAGTSARTVQLNPGDTAQSMLRDYSSCQAPLSDNARVTVPGETRSAVRPAELRACTLRVGPLTKQR